MFLQENCLLIDSFILHLLNVGHRQGGSLIYFALTILVYLIEKNETGAEETKKKYSLSMYIYAFNYN